MTYMPKQEVLAQAAQTLNRSELPWHYTFTSDSIIGSWKWMDATFFNQRSLNNQVQSFQFTVKLADDGTWKEEDRMEQAASGFGVGSNSGDGLTFSSNKNTSVGHINMKVHTLGVGIDHKTGQSGVIDVVFSTEDIKAPVRDLLTHYGWTRAKGFFGKLFGGKG